MEKSINPQTCCDVLGGAKGLAAKLGCCAPQSKGNTAAPCCDDASHSPMSEMMNKCMKACRWFPLALLALGASAFALGYFLDGETTRVLWLILSGLVVAVGTLALVAMGIMARKLR